MTKLCNHLKKSKIKSLASPKLGENTTEKKEKKKRNKKKIFSFGNRMLKLNLFKLLHS